MRATAMAIGRFIAGAKRRRLFRVAAVYAVAGWAVLSRQRFTALLARMNPA